MLTLNLLPPEQKENLNYEIDRRMVEFFGFWLSVIIVIFGILMLPALFFIALQQSEVERSLKVEEEARKAVRAVEFEEKITKTNALLDAILSREDRRRGVASFFEKILAVAPPGLALSFIAYEPAKSSATVVGVSDTRTTLLKFIDLLEKDLEIKAVSSPLSNIISERNVSFSLKIETKP